MPERQPQATARTPTAGYREKRWRSVQQIQPGDILLCYLTGVSRWIGILKVVGEPYRSNAPLWKSDTFPCRVDVSAEVLLEPETALPVTDFREQLTIFENLKNPSAWSWHFCTAPNRQKDNNGPIVADALREAAKNPVHRPVDPKKLMRKPGV
jgi:hypothetical protein